MKIKRELLIEKMSKVATVANYKEAKGIIRIELSEDETENKMNLFGSDGVNSAITTISYDEKVGGGTFYLDAKKVVNYLKNLGAFEVEDIDINFGEKEITITTGSAKFNFPIEVVNDYPQRSEVDFEKIEGNKYSVTCNSQVFHRKMSNVAKTIGNSDKPILAYCNVIATDSKLDFVTTDGIRVTLAKMAAETIDMESGEFIDEEIEFNLNPLILSRLLTPVSGVDVTLFITNDLIYVVDSESAIMLKTIKETFPKVRQMMPDVDFESGKIPFKSLLEIEGKEINNALSLLRAVLANEKNKRISFELSSESLSIESTLSKDQGKIRLEGTLTGESMKINFDILKLDVVNNGIEKLRIGFTDPKHPIFIFDASENNNFTNSFLLMPTL